MPVFGVRLPGARFTWMLDGGDGGTLLGVLCASADVRSIRIARDFVTQTLDAYAIGTAVVDDAVLIVSELLTNAVLHGSDSAECDVTVKLIGIAMRLRIEVYDASPLAPAQRLEDNGIENGRGLVIVDRLADRWGWEPTAVGKFVWCELAARPEQTPTDRA